MGAATEATEHLILRELASHVLVGAPSSTPQKVSCQKSSLPLQSVKPIAQKLNCTSIPRLVETVLYQAKNSSSPAIKHFFDIIYDVDPNLVNVDNLRAIIRDKAWDDFPDVMKTA